MHKSRELKEEDRGGQVTTLSIKGAATPGSVLLNGLCILLIPGCELVPSMEEVANWFLSHPYFSHSLSPPLSLGANLKNIFFYFKKTVTTSQRSVQKVEERKYLINTEKQRW